MPKKLYGLRIMAIVKATPEEKEQLQKCTTQAQINKLSQKILQNHQEQV